MRRKLLSIAETEHERQQNAAAIVGLINEAVEKTFSEIHKPAHPDSTPDLHTQAPGLLLSDVAAQQVHWLWPQRLPLGHLTLLEGNSGIGTPSHVGGLLFQQAIGARFTMIPYRGAGQALPVQCVADCGGGLSG